ncbi:hypothetical protein CHI02_07245 [Niallia circulans]|uniref:restriction endonuclease subunit S n=1 Tax=Niallia circulans TaxID=1397 RepID=UPI000BA6200D|nr:restriction endonuclease subunit S [Niallia circulans]PAE12670.1 hypothetical protein CHI02_07245 [Niallia circulans]
MNAPSLRFEGFSDDWKMTLLSDLMSFNNGINADKDSYGHGRKFINVLDILNNNSIKYKDIIGSVSVSQKVEETNKVEYGDLLFLRSSETREDVGKSSVYLDKDMFALFGGFVIRGKKHGDYHPYFLKLNLESPNVRNQISSKAGGSTRFNVSQSILSSIEISIPSQNEQKKIADFISHFDKKIQLQQKKIDLLKEQKKGYIQKIFNQELRFKDENGQTYNSWKECELKDIGSTFTGLSSKSKEDFGFGDHSFITYNNVFNNLFASKNGIEKVNVLETENQALVQKGDILLTTSSETPREVGMASLWNHSMEKIHLNSFCFGYRLNQTENILPEFVAISLRSEYMRKKIVLLAQGSTRFNMSKTQLMLQTIKIPCVEEQHKIVNFYKTLEQKLNLAKQQLEHLKTKKQAFMQQMFI